MSQMETVGSLIFHCLVTSHDVSSLVWLRWIGGFSWKSAFYFTIWSLMLQIFTSIVFVISDFSELLNGKGTSKSKMNSGHISNGNSSLYKFILFHLSFVTTIATGIMFWTIYAIDPTALNPKEFYYPLLLNNMHHTIPWIFSLVQIFIFAKREINSFALKIDVIRASEIGMVSLFLVAVCYSLTSLSRKVVFDVFPYPFMNDLTRIQYGIFNMFAIAFGLMISNISTQVLFQIARRMKKQSNLSKEN